MARKAPEISSYLSDMYDIARAWTPALYHVAFIPVVIAVGMFCTSPRPTVVQLLAPV